MLQSLHVLWTIGYKRRDCFGFFSLNVTQTYGKREEAPVASSNFSTFLFSSYTDVEGILKGVKQPLLMNNKKSWSSLVVAWIQGSAAMLG